jgi:type VI secretion system secreted protein VgrG
VIRATIDGVDDARSNVDDLGCYRIIFPFDTVQRPPGRSSCPVRLVTPYGGPTEGFHFPLRTKTQVMIAFHNGDPDRPVILGPLYDAVQKSVVTHGNRSVNMISTVSGITIKMNDGLPSGS